jgi:hypothetical protein
MNGRVSCCHLKSSGVEVKEGRRFVMAMEGALSTPGQMGETKWFDGLN